MPDYSSHQGIAIIGMAAMFPGARSVEKLWQNILSGTDALTEVPASRWESVFYDPHSTEPGICYCRRGGFLDEHISFDPTEFGIMPVAAQGAEPDQLLALRMAADALADAGVQNSASGERTGVILGRGGYLTPGIVRFSQYVRTSQQLVESLRRLVPGIAEDELARVKAEFRRQLHQVHPDSSIGLVPNLAASNIANRLNLRGPAYTIDAACASSLVAVDQAVRELETRRCDLVLAGGVQVGLGITFWSVFCQLGALSRSEQVRPFDRRADGLLIGEGVGVVALKRLDDALHDSNRIYAVIRGTGVASDGRTSSIINPNVEGQVLALERAWCTSGLEPATVGLIEAHGTGTPVGDKVELEALGRFFGPARGSSRAGLGSIKSMIGHAMPAAGVASLIKVALALHHRKLPPTLHCEEPHPLIERTRFRPIQQVEPWESQDGPRRAGVNAFGFGGINAHVVLEEAPAVSKRHRVRAKATTDRNTSLLLVEARSSRELLAVLDGSTPTAEKGPYRLALFDPTPARRDKARSVIERGKPWQGRQDMWFSPEGLAGRDGKVAFLFPGLSAVSQPEVDSLVDHFGLPQPQQHAVTELERQAELVIAMGRLLHAALERLGIQPNLFAGHSIGEWNGMIAAEMIPPDAVDKFIATLEPGNVEVPDVVFAALGCNAETAVAALQGLEAISVSHENCPRQSVICGRESSVDIALERLRKQQVMGHKLLFRSGFHSPLLADFIEPHRKNLAKLPLQPAKKPLWSSTSCRPYPDDPDEVRHLALRHLVEPVRFRTLIERLYLHGVRIFVQVGSGTLPGFVDDTLRDMPHLAVTTCLQKRSPLEQLWRVAAALYVEGVEVRRSELPIVKTTGTAPVRRHGRPIELALGMPLVLEATPLQVPYLVQEDDSESTKYEPIPDDPVFGEYSATTRQTRLAQREVIAALLGRTTGVMPRFPLAAPTRSVHLAHSPSRKHTWRHRLSTAIYPELSHHAFCRQPEGWPHLADRFPVVPITMLIDLMIEHALKLVPERVATAVEKVRAYRWLTVAPEVEIHIAARFDGTDRVRVNLGEYAVGTVVLAPSYPTPPAPESRSLERETAPHVTADQLYQDRWMFHGPAYQGVVDIAAQGSNGIRGTLLQLPARGALLDNAGQLLGYWIASVMEVDQLAFPFRIERIEFFDPPPAEGQHVPCRVHITSVSPTEVSADMELCVGRRLWARVTRWVDRRFLCNQRLFALIRFPERNLLSERRNGGYHVVTSFWRDNGSREFLVSHYLNQWEREDFEALPPRRKNSWLLGRIAAKDAVRDWLWRCGKGPIFPVEITVRTVSGGRPVVSGPFSEDLRISIAHKDDVALALVDVGREPDVDIERVVTWSPQSQHRSGKHDGNRPTHQDYIRQGRENDR